MGVHVSHHTIVYSICHMFFDVFWCCDLREEVALDLRSSVVFSLF